MFQLCQVIDGSSSLDHLFQHFDAFVYSVEANYLGA